MWPLSSGTPPPELARVVLLTSIGTHSATHVNAVLLDSSSTLPPLPVFVLQETPSTLPLILALTAHLPALGTQPPLRAFALPQFPT